VIEGGRAAKPRIEDCIPGPISEFDLRVWAVLDAVPPSSIAMIRTLEDQRELRQRIRAIVDELSPASYRKPLQ
jgi:hypothetical protein